MKNQPLPEKNENPQQKSPARFYAVTLWGTIAKKRSGFCFRSAFWQT